MIRRNIATFLVVGLVIISILGVFVFRVSGSDSSVSVEGCNPYNVKIEKGENENTAVISWKSKVKCSAYIVYGSEMKDLNMIGIDLDNDFKDSNHRVVVSSLLKSKTYYFTIVSEGVTYGKGGLPISFTISSL
jgi:hypothetical protein